MGTQPWPLVIAIDLARAPAVGLTVLKGTTLVAISLDIGADRSSITNRLRGAGVSVVDPPGGMGFMPPLPIPGGKMTAEEQWDGVLYGLATDIEFEYLGPQVRLVGLRRLDVGAVGADGGQRLAELVATSPTARLRVLIDLAVEDEELGVVLPGFVIGALARPGPPQREVLLSGWEGIGS